MRIYSTHVQEFDKGPGGYDKAPYYDVYQADTNGRLALIEGLAAFLES